MDAVLNSEMGCSGTFMPFTGAGRVVHGGLVKVAKGFVAGNQGIGFQAKGARCQVAARCQSAHHRLRQHQLVRKLLPARLRKHSFDITAGTAANKALCLTGGAMLRVQEHIGIHHAKAAGGNVIEVHWLRVLTRPRRRAQARP